MDWCREGPIHEKKQRILSSYYSILAYKDNPSQKCIDHAGVLLDTNIARGIKIHTKMVGITTVGRFYVPKGLRQQQIVSSKNTSQVMEELIKEMTVTAIKANQRRTLSCDVQMLFVNIQTKFGLSL